VDGERVGVAVGRSWQAEESRRERMRETRRERVRRMGDSIAEGVRGT
jgi:hypothetical protein